MTDIEVLVARIEERLIAIEYRLNEALLEMRQERKNYVTRNEFWPVRTIVYGMVAFILVSVLGAILAFVVRS